MIGVVIILLLVSATFSGLTIGMFSLSLGDLERKIKEGNKQAKSIYEIRKDGNLLLCTLLLGNTIVNSTIAVLISDLATGIWAATFSSVSIFLFAEVIPQALFSRHAFAVGAKTVWLVKTFRVLMYLVAKPMSMVLDLIFGKEYAQMMTKREVELLLEDHVESIDSDEKRIMVGAMKFSDKKAVEIMTPVTQIFRYEAKTVLNKEVLAKIKEEHYSRIPIYSETRDNIIGILYAKELIGYELSTAKTVEEMCRKNDLTFVEENIKLDVLMNHMIQERVHLAFVFDQFHSLSGIVSLEDIMEEILTVEIMDETDTDADLQHKAKNSNTKIFLK
jgi:metal transporter CNNM